MTFLVERGARGDFPATPFLPGYAAEVDALALGLLILTFLWLRAAWKGSGNPGLRWIALWWTCALILLACEAALPWLQAGSSWLPSLRVWGQALFGGLAVLAALDALAGDWIRTSRRLPLTALGMLCGAAGGGYVLLISAFGFALRLIVLHVNGTPRKPETACWLGAGLVLAGFCLRPNLADALWPGLLSPELWQQWLPFFGLVLWCFGGILWWSGECQPASRHQTLLAPNLPVLPATLGVCLLALVAIGIGDFHLRRRLAESVTHPLFALADSLPSEDLDLLGRGMGSPDHPAHRRIWEALEQEQARNPEARAIYLMRSDGINWSLPTSTARDWDAARAQFNQPYRKVHPTDAWVLSRTQASFLPPAVDFTGLIVSGLVPVWEGPEGRMLLGVDYPGPAWSRGLMLLRLPSLGLILAGGLCCLLYLRAVRRHSEALIATSVLAGVSSELRTPLQAILGYTELLLKSRLEREQERQLAHIRSLGLHSDSLVRHMLDLATARHGRIRIRPVECSLPDTLTEAVVALTPEAETKGLVLNLTISEAVPFVIHADADRLRQVMLNLLSNAVRYTRKGEVNVAVTRGGRDWICIRVSDTGIGITDAERAGLFQAFMRGHEARGMWEGGVGLGLNLSRRVAQSMGGDLQLEPDTGRGSVFLLRIPCRAIPKAASDAGTGARAESPATPKSAASRQEPAEDAGAILIVEDHPAIGRLLMRYAAAIGRRATLATSLAQARDRLRIRPLPSLLITERSLCDGDGYELANEPELLATGEVWRIALAANGSAANRRLARGFDVFLLKPCSLDQFAEAVAACPWLPGPTPDQARRSRPPPSPDDYRKFAESWMQEIQTALLNWAKGGQSSPSPDLADNAAYLGNGARVLGERYAMVASSLAAIERKARRGIRPMAEFAALRQALSYLGY